MEDFWLFLEPYTFIFEGDGFFMIYNSINYKRAVFPYENKYHRLVKHLNEPSNMYCIKISFEEKCKLSELIDFIRLSYSGDVVSTEITPNQPAIIPPYPYIINDIQKGLNSNLQNCLFSLSLYLPTPQSNAGIEYNDQYILPKRMEKKQPLSLDNYIDFLGSIDYFIPTINLLGGNIWTCEWLDKLISNCLQITDNLYIVSHICDIPKELNKFINSPQISIKCLIDDEIIKKNDLSHRVDAIMKQFNVDFVFVISSMDGYLSVERLIKDKCIESYIILPYFTNDNYDFIKEYVFLDREDVFDISLSKPQVFRNMLVNKMYFGNLIIDENGYIYTNPSNKTSLNIRKDSLNSILNYCISSSTSFWLKTRKDGKCQKCVHRFLCPPITELEIKTEGVACSFIEV